MKINFALMSHDNNPLYTDFIPVIKEAWNKLGIIPVFVVVGDKQAFHQGFDTDRYIQIEVPKIDGIDLAFQSMTARIWAMNLLSGNCIISDLDMMPLSSMYFNGIAENGLDEIPISYCSDAKEKFGMIGACYVLANYKTFQKYVGNISYEQWIKNVANDFGDKWGHEQLYLEKFVNDNNGIHLKRGWNEAGQANRRLDRDNWNYTTEQLEQGYFFDAHLPRPYSKHKESIDTLLKYIKWN